MYMYACVTDWTIHVYRSSILYNVNLCFIFYLKNKNKKQDKSVKDVSLKKMEERDKKKMDQLKKKLHTDDEGNFSFGIRFYRLMNIMTKLITNWEANWGWMPGWNSSDNEVSMATLQVLPGTVTLNKSVLHWNRGKRVGARSCRCQYY